MKVPQLDDVWVDLAQASTLKYAVDAPLALSLWEQPRPEAYDWTHDDADTLHERLQAEDDREVLAREFTMAVARDCEAYAHMQLWKVHELVTATVEQLNSVRPAAAAATARSALESAIALASADFRENDVFAGARSAAEVPERLAKFSDFVDRSVWGRRGDLRVLDSINVLTLKEALIKKSTDPETTGHLDSIYGNLCDVVHPSASGHQLHWQPSLDAGSGPVLVPLRYGDPTLWAVAVAELSLWAIGWSTAWSIRAFDNIVKRTASWAAVGA